MKHPPKATGWWSLAPGGQWFPALVLMAATAAILLCLSLWGPTPQPALAPAPTPGRTASPVGDCPADLPLGEALLQSHSEYYPDYRADGDTWEMIFSAPGQGRTLAVLQYHGTHAAGLSNLIIGVMDDATLAPTQPLIEVHADDSALRTWTEGDKALLLYTGTASGQGWEGHTGAGLLAFDGVTLEPITALPAVANAVTLPAGAENLLDPDRSADFWAERKAALTLGGLDLYRRNPDYPPDGSTTVTQWHFECYVPLAPDGPDPRLMDAARTYLEEDLREVEVASFRDASAFPIVSLTPVDQFTDPARPAQVFLLNVGLRDSEETFERYLLFDGNGNFIGARSPQVFTLYNDGYPLRLGMGDLWLFGTPSGHKTLPGGDGYSMYSEWFSPDGNSCGYSYYYGTDEYRLCTINTIQPDVFTSRDIHVGSTVAQVLEAYPELATTTFSTQTNCLTVYEPVFGRNGCRLEFYFDTSGGFPESREDTLARPITAISLAASHW